ncbi:MAG: hypothetical protein ACLSVD_09940 [Eggerthellaceae bacterium]
MGKLTDEEFRDFLKTCRELAEAPSRRCSVRWSHQQVPQVHRPGPREQPVPLRAAEEYGGWGFTEEILQVREVLRGRAMRMHLHYAADLNWHPGRLARRAEGRLLDSSR